MYANKLVVTLVFFPMITGCTAFTPPLERTVDQNQIANIGALSTVASRRVVIVSSKFSKNELIDSKFCAEPSPDVTENIVSNLTSKVDASGSAETKESIAKMNAAIKAELAKSLNTNGSALIKRTQGAQYYRDGLYNLCQAHINGAISQDEYTKKLDEIYRTSAELIKIELPLMYQITKPAPDVTQGAKKE